MDARNLITLLNSIALLANVAVAIAGTIILRDARKANREFRQYMEEYRKRYNL